MPEPRRMDARDNEAALCFQLVASCVYARASPSFPAPCSNVKCWRLLCDSATSRPLPARSSVVRKHFGAHTFYPALPAGMQVTN